MSKKICTVELAGQRYTLKFNNRAINTMEEIFGHGILQIIQKEEIAAVRFASAAVYAGRLWEKKKLPLGWSFESAEELIDEHEDAGGSWMDISETVGPIIARKIPQIAAAMDEAEAEADREAEAAKKEVANPLSTEATAA